MDGVFEIHHVTEAREVLAKLEALLPSSIVARDHLTSSLSSLSLKAESLHETHGAVFATFDPRSELKDWPECYAILHFWPGTLDGLVASVHTSWERQVFLQEDKDDHLKAVVQHVLRLLKAVRDSSQLRPRLIQGTFGEDMFVIGGCPAGIAQGLCDERVLVKELHAYQLWLLRRASLVSRPDDAILPQGLFFDRVEQDIDAEEVDATNPVVMGTRSLLAWTGLGLRDQRTGLLAAWAFWGSTGELRTLFVREEMRGRGLSRKLIARMLRPEPASDVKLPSDQRPTRDLMHVHIDQTNAPSLRLFKGFGAKEGWDVCWPRVDLKKLA